MTFQDFNLRAELQKAIEQAGFKEPSPIQKEAIPLILAKKDVVGQAHTGTGKTAAFALPMLNMLKLNGEVEGLVIVPTRELATQVSDEIFRFGKYLKIKTAAVYGGSSYSRQLHHIENASIVVATPGRLLDLLKSGKIELNPDLVVLDEADEMLDMGFLDDIKAIFEYLPSNRQTMLFSATMPNAIKELANKILYTPEFISITKENVTNENIKQYYYVVDERERDDALIRLLDYKAPSKAIIFCRMKIEVDRLNEFLNAQGIKTKGLHGDIPQRERENIIKSFKRGDTQILIATDVAARGLDISDVTHVFNYHIPFDPESYVHRIGRTGRAGKEGTAISLVIPAEFKQLIKIQKSVKSSLINKEIPTISELKSKKQKSILDTILSTKVSTQAIELLELLESQTDLSTAALKLASMVIENDKVKGSEKIGKSKKEAELLMKKAQNEKKRPRDRGRRGRSQRRY